MSQPPRNRKERRALQRHAKQRPRKPEHWLAKAKRDREVEAILYKIGSGAYAQYDEFTVFDEGATPEPGPAE